MRETSVLWVLIISSLVVTARNGAVAHDLHLTRLFRHGDKLSRPFTAHPVSHNVSAVLCPSAIEVAAAAGDFRSRSHCSFVSPAWDILTTATQKCRSRHRNGDCDRFG